MRKGVDAGAASARDIRAVRPRGTNQVDLVLSLFPGIGLLDMAFEAEGFCVVRAPGVYL